MTTLNCDNLYQNSLLTDSNSIYKNELAGLVSLVPLSRLALPYGGNCSNEISGLAVVELSARVPNVRSAGNAYSCGSAVGLVH